MKKGRLFVISGPSGSGKTTLAEKVLRLKGLRGRVLRSVSFTTRPKRPMEKEGRDYFFLSREEFFRLRRVKKILEWTKYLEYYYGTPKDFVDKVLSAGKHLVLCIDVKGAESIRALYPKESVTIFIMPPSLETLRERIEKRCVLAPSEVSRRVAQASREIRKADKYRYVIVNDRLTIAVRQLKEVLLKHAGRGNE